MSKTIVLTGMKHCGKSTQGGILSTPTTLLNRYMPVSIMKSCHAAKSSGNTERPSSGNSKLKRFNL